MVTLRMAFRNIFRQRRRSFFTGLSIVGGFTLAVVFIGWADGSYDNIIAQFTGSRLGQIQIHRKGYLDRPSLNDAFSGVARLGAILEGTKGVVSWAPRIYCPALASAGEKSVGAEIIGIDPSREAGTTRFDRQIITGRALGSPEAREVILGQGLAEVLAARLGDEIVLLSQGSDGSLADGRFSLVGIASTGDSVTDRTAAYMPLRTAQALLVLDDKVHEIAIVISRLGRAEALSREIARSVNAPALAVDPWQVFARSFYEAMKADKAGMWVMLVVIVIIVAVGVLNTVLMSVLERRREYGLLKALGTRPRGVVGLVLLESVLLALMAMVIGSGLGLGANAFLSKHGIKFSSGLTYGGMVFDTMKSEINARSFLIPAVTVIISAVIVSLVPAWKASRTEPAKTMRMH